MALVEEMIMFVKSTKVLKHGKTIMTPNNQKLFQCFALFQSGKISFWNRKKIKTSKNVSLICTSHTSFATIEIDPFHKIPKAQEISFENSVMN